MPRALTTSASACKKLMKKAEVMGIDAAALEFQEAQVINVVSICQQSDSSLNFIFRLHL